MSLKFLGRRARFVVATMVIVAGLGAFGVTQRTPSTQSLVGVPSTNMSISPGSGSPPGMYAQSGFLVGAGAQPAHLAATPSSPLTGWLSPALVPSQDRRTIVYSTWRQARADDATKSWIDQGIGFGDTLGTPEIRKLDSLTGVDTLMESGATTPMLSEDGRLAYVRGVTTAFAAGSPYAGAVMVRATVDGLPVAWSDATQRWAVAAWAGPHLLAYTFSEGESLQLYAFDGPHTLRPLGAGTLVAVSPDGEQVLTEESEGAEPRLSLVRVSDGVVLSSLTPDPALGIDAFSYAGAWTNERIVVRTGSGLAIVHAGDPDLSIVQVLRFDTLAFPSGVIQPRFANFDGTEITAWADMADATGSVRRVELDCQTATSACTYFPMVDATAQPAYNPSAPFAA